MANLSAYYPLPIVAGTTAGTFAAGDSAAHVGQANTFTQNQTLNGTNNVAPNQTAASGSSIMTRDLVREAISDIHTPRRFTIAHNANGWAEAATNGGSFATVLIGRFLSTSSNTAGTAIRYTSSFEPRLWGGVGAATSGSTGINWSRRTEFSFNIECNISAGLGLIHIRFGENRASTTLGPVSVRGVGITLDSANVSGFVHNGTTLTTQTLTAFSAGVNYVRIVNLGTGSVEFWINRTLCWTSATSEGPTGWGGQENTQVAYMVDSNGGSTGASMKMYDTQVTIYE